MNFAKKLACTLAAAALLVPVLILLVSASDATFASDATDATDASAASAVEATPAQPVIRVDGTEYRFDAYDVLGSRCFRLHDIAYALAGTGKQFQATFDGLNKEIGMISKVTVAEPSDGTMPALWMPCGVFLNGTEFTLTAYIIGAYSYVKLLDLAKAVDFDVKYSAESDTIEIDTSAAYPSEQEVTAACALDVTFIGDSIGVGVTPYLKEFYPGLYADAKVSRQFSAAKGIIQQLLQNGKLGSVVVIELGTNGAFSEAQMRAVIALIGSDRKIVFVNTQMPRSWCGAVNQTLSKVSAEYSNVAIADWYSASIKKSVYFHEDGVHTNSIGAQVLAGIIADTIAKTQAS